MYSRNMATRFVVIEIIREIDAFGEELEHPLTATLAPLIGYENNLTPRPILVLPMAPEAARELADGRSLAWWWPSAKSRAKGNARELRTIVGGGAFTDWTAANDCR